MAEAFTGEQLVIHYYQDALRSIFGVLKDFGNDRFETKSDDEWIAGFLEAWELEPLEEDPSRPASAEMERIFLEGRGGPLDPPHHEVVYALVDIALVPKQQNGAALRLYSEDGWPSMTGIG